VQKFVCWHEVTTYSLAYSLLNILLHNRTFYTVVYGEVATKAAKILFKLNSDAYRYNECLRLVYVACLDVGVRQLNWK